MCTLQMIFKYQNCPTGPCYPTKETLLTQGGVLSAALCYQRPLISGLFRHKFGERERREVCIPDTELYPDSNLKMWVYMHG